MRLILIRHGETHMNKEHLILGLKDLPLNSTGIWQAKSLAIAMASEKPFVLYSSPVTRALETARAISQLNNVPIIEMSELREMDAGKLEGLSFEEAHLTYPYVMDKWSNDPGSTTMPDGESFSMVQDRAWRAIKLLLRQHQSQKVVAVTHNFVILSVLCKVLSLTLPSFRRFKIDLGSMTTIDFDNNDATIISVNRCCNPTKPGC